MKTAEDILKDKGGKLVSVAPDATVRDAITHMAEAGIGSILVMDGDELSGIWTERDLVKQSVTDTFSLDTTLMRDCMVSRLEYTPHTHSLYQLMDKIVGKRQRRLLVKKDDQFIGLLTSGDVMRALLQDKSHEIQELNAIVGWEYYEDWRWAPGQSREK